MSNKTSFIRIIIRHLQPQDPLPFDMLTLAAQQEPKPQLPHMMRVSSDLATLQ
jgi:hypothetical protein